MMTEEFYEKARLYAESRIGKDWDRTDANKVGVFYKYYIEKFEEEIGRLEQEIENMYYDMQDRDSL